MPHWTANNMHSYIFAVASSFIIAAENVLEERGQSYKDLAKLLDVAVKHVMDQANNPAAMSLGDLYRWARALGMKFSLVLYDDHDPTNNNGPVNNEIFRQCWELLGRPHTQGQVDEAAKQYGLNK